MNHTCVADKKRVKLLGVYSSFRQYVKSLAECEDVDMVALVEQLERERLPIPTFDLRRIDHMTVNNKVAAGMKEAIRYHGPIHMGNMNSALKRIVNFLLGSHNGPV